MNVAQWHPLDGTPYPDYPPPFWDSGWVSVRMVDAYRVLRSLPGRVGPECSSGQWPDILAEWGDLIEAEAWRNRQRENSPRQVERWTSDEIARADEALAWPLAYLFDRPMMADAISVWAFARASRRSLRGIL